MLIPIHLSSLDVISYLKQYLRKELSNYDKIDIKQFAPISIPMLVMHIHIHQRKEFTRN